MKSVRFSLVLALTLASSLGACRTLSTVAGPVVKIGQDVCSAVEDAGSAPGWVDVICLASDGSRVRVQLQASQWAAMTSKPFDGGNGI